MLRPDPWLAIPPDERERRATLDSDLCSIDDEHFFIRGLLEIPLLDAGETFGIGVWVSQKRENFLAYVEKFDDSAGIGPFFGWLSNRLPLYPDTTNLKTLAHFRDSRLRPSIELEPTDHPLAVDQRSGISLAKAWEIVHAAGPAR